MTWEKNEKRKFVLGRKMLRFLSMCAMLFGALSFWPNQSIALGSTLDSLKSKLNQLPPEARQQVNRFYSDDPKERALGVYNLGQNVSLAQAAVPFLIAELDDRLEVQLYVGGQLSSSGPIYSYAMDVLVKVGAPAIPQLIGSLETYREKNENLDLITRENVALILGRLKASEAVEPLLGLLAEQKQYVHAREGKNDEEETAAVVMALGQIGDPRAVDALVVALKDSSGEVRHASAESLKQLAWKAHSPEDQIDLLIANDKWNELKQIGSPAVPRLIEIVEKDDSWLEKKEAIDVLAEIGDSRALRPLRAVLGDTLLGKAAKTAIDRIAKREAKPG
jgi:HEAT repeats